MSKIKLIAISRTILEILLLLSPIYAYSHSSSYKFINFDVKSGLADNYVQSIVNDEYGFIWLATNNGLDRYDGYKFKHYSTGSLDADNNEIKKVYTDASNSVWVKSRKKYLIYDRLKDRLNDNISMRLLQFGIKSKIYFLHVDEDKNLWCADSDSLYYYNFRTSKLKSYDISSWNNEIIQLAGRGVNAYVLFDNKNLLKINLENDNISVLDKLKFAQSNSQMYIDIYGTLWHFNIHSVGLWKYNDETNKWTSPTNISGIKGQLITDITNDSKNNLWIATDNAGIFVYNKDNNSTYQIKQDVNSEYSLPNMHINCIHLDDKDNMWVGFIKQGIAFTRLNNLLMDVINFPTKQEDVCFIKEDKNGNIWFGFDGNGIAFYNTKNKKYTKYLSTDIPSNIATSGMTDRNNNFIFGTFGGGINTIKNGKIVPWKAKDLNKNPIPLKYIRDMLSDKYGNIWLGTFMEGLYYFNGDSINSLKLDQNIKKIHGISDLVYDGEDNLYVGTYQGLYVVNVKTLKAKRLYTTTIKNKQSSEEHIRSLCIDKFNQLWVGTRLGLRMLSPNRSEITNFDIHNGLSDNYIRAIAEDKDNNIWVTTDNGISYIYKDENNSSSNIEYKCIPYYSEDGFGDLTFNNISICVRSSGEILMGSTHGYLSFTPHLEEANQNAKPHLIFTGLQIGNESIEVGKEGPEGNIILDKNIQLKDKLELNYAENSFTIEFSAIDFANLHKIHYKYRLDDEDWTNLSGNKIYFNKLSPGNYKLEIEAYQNNPNVEPIKNSIVLVIEPPFWLSHTAFSIYILLIAALVTLLTKRNKQRHKRELEKQKNELEIARLKAFDESKTKFFTDLSHDLKTPLSLIIAPLEQIIPKSNNKEERAQLEIMHRNANILLNEVNQLLDFRKLDAGKAEIRYIRGNISHFVENIANEFYSFAENKSITLKFINEAGDIEMDFDQKKMRRILQNLLSNAFKYNYKNGEVIITLRRKYIDEKDMICIEVADTGIGIDTSQKEFVFDRFYRQEHSSNHTGSGIGLHIAYEYAVMHKGYIKVKDNKPKGSRFTVYIPISLSNKAITHKFTDTDNENGKVNSDNYKTILVVEDNSDFRAFISNSLQSKYNVITSSDGYEAKEALTKFKVDIIITDLMMPGIDGNELCSMVKNDISFSHIPIIMLSAQNSREQILKSLESGADEYLTKPFNMDMLMLKIEKMLNWTKNNHNIFSKIEVKPKDITVSSIDEELITKAINIVEENMANSNFNVEELSSKIGISRGHLYRKLNSITGKSPVEFIRVIRVKRGRQLIEQDNGSISEIAHSIGLSPKQFTKYFKCEYDLTPSDFKQQINR